MAMMSRMHVSSIKLSRQAIVAAWKLSDQEPETHRCPPCDEWHLQFHIIICIMSSGTDESVLIHRNA